MIRAFLLALTAGLALLSAPARPLPGEVVPWQSLFVAVAGVRWVDRAAQVQAESAFNPLALSPVGAKGAAQFMDRTWADEAPAGSSPFDVQVAIPTQNKYMNKIEGRVHRDRDKGLGGYNAGLGNVLQAQRYADALGLLDRSAWLRTLPRVTGERNAGETRGYVKRNASNRAAISARLGITP